MQQETSLPQNLQQPLQMRELEQQLVVRGLQDCQNQQGSCTSTRLAYKAQGKQNIDGNVEHDVDL